MFISCNLLLTRLSILHPKLIIETKNPLPLAPLKGIKQLPKKQAALSSDYIYLFDDTHPILKEDNFYNQSLHHTQSLIFITDTEKSFNDYYPYIILRTDEETACISNDLHDIFMYFLNWEQKLDIALIQGESIKNLLNISESVLGYPILIYDASLKVIAYSESKSLDDGLFQDVIDKGYLPSHIVFRFEQDNIFTKLKEHGIIYGNYLSSKEFTDILLSLKINDYTVAYIAMPDVPRSLSIYSGELIQLLAEKICHYLEREQEHHLTKRYMHEYLLSDLFENDSFDISTLRERLEYINIPFEGIFYLMKIQLSSSFTISSDHLYRLLETLLPEALISVLQDDFYILFHYNGLHISDMIQRRFIMSLKTIRKELVHENAICGISRMFFKLTDIRTARLESDAAISLYHKLNLTPEHKIYCFYENCSIYHLFQICSEHIDLEAFCHPAIIKMRENDHIHDLNHLLILKTYLQSHGKITEAAQSLHMHRNNVIYHIKRMENLYHFNLSDYQEKFHIELTLKILEYLYQ